MEQIKGFVVEDCDLPERFDVEQYEFFQGMPTKILRDRDAIDIGGRHIEVLQTPCHSPGHMCFYEKERGYLCLCLLMRIEAIRRTKDIY